MTRTGGVQSTPLVVHQAVDARLLAALDARSTDQASCDNSALLSPAEPGTLPLQLQQPSPNEATFVDPVFNMRSKPDGYLA